MYKEKDGFIVSMKWLKETFKCSVTYENSKEEISRAVRAYLLYVLGSVIFPNKSGNRIPISYLENFINLDTVNQINWGCGLLTYLYKQMGDASHVKCVKIGGYLTLLQAWIYIHFPTFAVDSEEPWWFTDSSSMARKYNPPSTVKKGVDDVVLIRKQLDDILPEKIDDRVILSTGGFNERYHPDRVVRQFGYVQGIPAAPIILEQLKCDSISILHAREKVPTDLPSKCDDEYLAWFTSISHPRVHPPGECINDCIWNEGVNKAITKLEMQVLNEEDKKSSLSASTIAMKDAIDILCAIPLYKDPKLDDVSDIEDEEVECVVSREVRSKHFHDKHVTKKARRD